MFDDLRLPATAALTPGLFAMLPNGSRVRVSCGCVRATHHPLRQRWRRLTLTIAATGALLAACASEELPPSTWPPADFEFVAEEIVHDGDRFDTVRKFRLTADGLAVYGTSARALVGAGEAASVSLPVFERLSVYRLVPSAVRGFARRLHRLGFLGLEDNMTEQSLAAADDATPMVVLKWSSVDGQKRHAVRGNPRGQLAEMLRVLTSHLPVGEQFAGIDPNDRAAVTVLRGVPAPRADVQGALLAHMNLLAERGEDAPLLGDTFALACRAASRAVAEDLLARWLQASRPPAAQRGAFPDEPEGADVTAVMRQLLPAH